MSPSGYKRRNGSPQTTSALPPAPEMWVMDRLLCESRDQCGQSLLLVHSFRSTLRSRSREEVRLSPQMTQSRLSGRALIRGFHAIAEVDRGGRKDRGWP